MKINKIILENIGPYIGINEFDFSISKGKNLILIGGKNGSGKTTLLKAIKLGIFGSFSLGLKNDSKIYFDEIKKLINLECRAYNFSICFDLCINEEGVANSYILRRSWILKNNEIDESVKVYFNNEEYNEYQTLEFMEKIKSYTSPKLINSYIFDGETIGNIIQNGHIQDFLKETFESIFNINLINQLTNDLSSYLEKRSSENVSTKEVYAQTLITEINSLKANIKILNEHILNLKNKQNELSSKKKSIKKEFTSLGGLSKEQQKTMFEEVTKLAKESDKKQKFMIDFYENELVFFLNMNLLKQSLKQAKDEIPLKYIEELRNIEKYLNKNFPEIKSELLKKVKCNDMIHDISLESINMIQEKINRIENNIETAKTNLLGKESDQYKIVDMKNALSNQDDIEKLNKLILEIQDIDDALFLVEQEINENESQCSDMKYKFEKGYSNFEKLNNEIRKSNTYDNSFYLAINTININNSFTEKLILSKLETVSLLTLEIFNQTIRKENYIKNVIINSNFTIDLFDYEGIKKNIQTLSAGEEQLLISSIIWAMFKVSGKLETFIFDTPLARLDKENRIAFINNIIKTISPQVIVLSTNSEMVAENFNAIIENVSKMYRLDYHDSKKATEIVEGYF